MSIVAGIARLIPAIGRGLGIGGGEAAAGGGSAARGALKTGADFLFGGEGGAGLSKAPPQQGLAAVNEFRSQKGLPPVSELPQALGGAKPSAPKPSAPSGHAEPPPFVPRMPGATGGPSVPGGAVGTGLGLLRESPLAREIAGNYLRGKVGDILSEGVETGPKMPKPSWKKQGPSEGAPPLRKGGLELDVEGQRYNKKPPKLPKKKPDLEQGGGSPSGGTPSSGVPGFPVSPLMSSFIRGEQESGPTPPILPRPSEHEPSRPVPLRAPPSVGHPGPRRPLIADDDRRDDRSALLRPPSPWR